MDGSPKGQGLCMGATEQLFLHTENASKKSPLDATAVEKF